MFSPLYTACICYFLEHVFLAFWKRILVHLGAKTCWVPSQRSSTFIQTLCCPKSFLNTSKYLHEHVRPNFVHDGLGTVVEELVSIRHVVDVHLVHRFNWRFCPKFKRLRTGFQHNFLKANMTSLKKPKTQRKFNFQPKNIRIFKNFIQWGASTQTTTFGVCLGYSQIYRSYITHSMCKENLPWVFVKQVLGKKFRSSTDDTFVASSETHAARGVPHKRQTSWTGYRTNEIESNVTLDTLRLSIQYMYEEEKRTADNSYVVTTEHRGFEKRSTTCGTLVFGSSNY